MYRWPPFCTRKKDCSNSGGRCGDANAGVGGRRLRLAFSSKEIEKLMVTQGSRVQLDQTWVACR